MITENKNGVLLKQALHDYSTDNESFSVMGSCGSAGKSNVLTTLGYAWGGIL